MSKVARLSSTYLLQQDVLVDDSLVPLGVRALAAVFGPPLVLSTGGWGKSRGEGKRGRRWGDTRVRNSSFYRRVGASGDEWTTTTMQREQQQSGAGHTTGRLSTGKNDVMHTVWMFASFFLFFFVFFWIHVHGQQGTMLGVCCKKVHQIVGICLSFSWFRCLGDSLVLRCILQKSKSAEPETRERKRKCAQPVALLRHHTGGKRQATL